MDRHQVLSFNEGNIAEFRASGGRIASFGAAPVLLVTTIGARTGSPRTSPMMYLDDEHDPTWCKSSPPAPTPTRPGSTTCSPTRGSSSRSTTAPSKNKTTRPIPVVALTLHSQEGL